MLLMNLDNGVQASYLQCHYTPDDQRNYTVIGSAGRIENFGDHSSGQHEAEVHLWNRRSGYSREGHEVFRIPCIEGDHGGADPLLIGDFVNFLRGEPSAGASPCDARNAVAVGCCGTESLRQGCEVRHVPALHTGSEPTGRSVDTLPG